MADGFELYHIPQQSRRDKLRTLVGDLQGCAGLGLLPLYDPSSLLSPSPNFLSCANAKQTTNSLMAADDSNNSSSNASDYMIGRAVIDTISNNNQSLDMQPVRDEDNGHCSFLYAHQDLRLIHHHDTMSYQPETLALSLSSHNTLEGNQPLGLNLQRYESTLGPYTGYASILKGSKFLKPAQQLLDEICDVGFGIYAEKFGVDCGLMMDLPPLESLRTSVVDDTNYGGGDKSKKSRLISLLDEVVKRYKQYYQQIQAVIASFETVAGLGRAAPFANLDLKAMSKHFRCLNNAITDQLRFSNKSHEHHISYAKEELLYGQNVRYVDHQPVWRPQRGLPKRAVTVLRAWLFDHFLHPYPTDTDKQLLAKQTGLSRNQVSNWFINARVRLWKPMVEEVHTLETRQVHKVSSHILDQETPPPGDTLLTRETNQNPPSKRAKNNFPGNSKYNNNYHLVEANKEQMNFYDNFSIQSDTNGNRGVSLTLGLHQNNNNNNNNSGITLSEPMSGYVMGGFDAENRHFGRGIIGSQGQFLHDFGG